MLPRNNWDTMRPSTRVATSKPWIFDSTIEAAKGAPFILHNADVTGLKAANPPATSTQKSNMPAGGQR